MPAHRHVVPPRATKGHLTLTERELKNWGEELGRASSAPLLITLTGELGVGKTTLTQAICRGYGVSDEITSPTYGLIHEYCAPKSAGFPIHLFPPHLPGQATKIGGEENAASRAPVVVEGPEGAGGRGFAAP